MSVITQTIRVDLNTGMVIPTAFVHQNDTARSLVFDMYLNGEAFNVSSYTVKFAYVSPTVNGQHTVISGNSMASGLVSDNKVTVTLPSAYTAISGVGLLTMIITPSSGTIRPVNIRLVVQKSADGANEIAGASDFPTTLQQIADEWYNENIAEWLDENIDAVFDGNAFIAAVDHWLDSHPEATTTVQDHSLTMEKLVVGTLGYVTPEMYGAKGDGVTDDTDAVQEAFTHKNVMLDGSYLVTDTISGADVENIESRNGKIFGSVSAPILSINKFDYTAIGSLVSDATKGSTLSLISEATVGDIVALKSTSLFNSARSYYNDCEFNRVLDDNVLEHPYYSDYSASSTSVYKITMGKLVINGTMTVENQLADVSDATAVVLNGLTDSNISGLVAISKGSNAIQILQCYGISIDAIARCQPSDTWGLEYGCVIANSQDVILTGQYYGNRHGVATGGGGQDVNPVNRNIKYNGIFKNKQDMNLPALDLHGNCEFVEISGIIDNGIGFGGKNINISNVIIKDAVDSQQRRVATALYGAELLNGDFVIDSCQIKGFYGSHAAIASFNFGDSGADPVNIVFSNIVSESNSECGIRTYGTSSGAKTISISNVIINSTAPSDFTRLVWNSLSTEKPTVRMSNVVAPALALYDCNNKMDAAMGIMNYAKATFTASSSAVTINGGYGFLANGVKRINLDISVNVSTANAYTSILTVPSDLVPMIGLTKFDDVSLAEGDADDALISLSTSGLLQVRFTSTGTRRMYLDFTYI